MRIAATVLVVGGVTGILAHDLLQDPRSVWRTLLEAGLPFAGALALVWWAWTAM